MTIQFDASASFDDGAITKYEWDLDGNGTYETDTGSNDTATKVYSSPGTVGVRLRVTDDSNKTTTTTVVTVPSFITGRSLIRQRSRVYVTPASYSAIADACKLWEPAQRRWTDFQGRPTPCSSTGHRPLA